MVKLSEDPFTTADTTPVFDRPFLSMTTVVPLLTLLPVGVVPFPLLPLLLLPPLFELLFPLLLLLSEVLVT